MPQVNETRKYATGRHRGSDATPEIEQTGASPELESPTRLMK